MDLVRALESFAAVAELGSFSEAARHLRLTPSAISKQIATLEADLGVSLMLRTTRGLSLTTPGSEYLARALRILAEVAAAQDVARGHAGAPRGVLRIAAPATLGRMHVSPAIPHFMSLFPDLSVELRLYDRQADPIAAGVDLSIRAGHLQDSTMIAAKLAATHRLLVAAPRYLERHGTPRRPEDLRKHNCLLSTLYTVRNTWYFTKGNATRSIVVNGTFSTNNSEGLRDVVLGGIGLGLLGSWAIAPYLRSGQLVSIMTDWRGELTRDVRNIYAVYPRTAHVAPAVRSFVDFLRHYLGSPPYWETGEEPHVEGFVAAAGKSRKGRSAGNGAAAQRLPSS